MKQKKWSKLRDWFWYQKERLVDVPFRFMLKRTVWKLSLSCWLWKLRGLPTCDKHGFHAQSWITGKCRECERDKLMIKDCEISRREKHG